jgi:hypothetical protein
VFNLLIILLICSTSDKLQKEMEYHGTVTVTPERSIAVDSERDECAGVDTHSPEFKRRRPLTYKGCDDDPYVVGDCVIIRPDPDQLVPGITFWLATIMGINVNPERENMFNVQYFESSCDFDRYRPMLEPYSISSRGGASRMGLKPIISEVHVSSMQNVVRLTQEGRIFRSDVKAIRATVDQWQQHSENVNRLSGTVRTPRRSPHESDDEKSDASCLLDYPVELGPPGPRPSHSQTVSDCPSSESAAAAGAASAGVTTSSSVNTVSRDRGARCRLSRRSGSLCPGCLNEYCQDCSNASYRTPKRARVQPMDDNEDDHHDDSDCETLG